MPGKWGLRAWLFFATALLLVGLGLWQQRHFFHDDAYVPLRYAERILAGQGLTWTDGERVEGFSSPAWLGQVTLLGGLGVPLPLAVRVLGIAYALAVFVLWYRSRGDPAGLMVLASLPGFSLWAWGGLETISACFWTLAAVVLVVRLLEDPAGFRRGFPLGLSLTMVALGRPEGIGVSLALLCVAWPGRRNRHVLKAAGGFLLAYLAYEIFRLAYFGDWVANAARAKTFGIAFAPRLHSATVYLIRTAPMWIGAVLFSLWVLAGLRTRVVWPLLAIVPLLVAVVLAGGDHMLGARLMLAPAAVMCMLAALAPPARRAWVRRTAPTLAVLCALWQFDMGWSSPSAPDGAAAAGEIVGRALEAKLPARTLVAVATAGSVPYFAPSIAFIDTLGLNNQHIARTPPAVVPAAIDRSDAWFRVPGHRRGDGAYVLSRAPDVVMFGGAKGDLQPWFLSDYQLAAAKQFQESYAPWRITVAVPPGSRSWLVDEVDADTGLLPITLYVRRDSATWAAIAREGHLLSPPWAKLH